MSGHTEEVLDVAFDLTGQHLVTCSVDGTGRVYDTATQQLVSILEGHENEISKVIKDIQGTK